MGNSVEVDNLIPPPTQRSDIADAFSELDVRGNDFEGLRRVLDLRCGSVFVGDLGVNALLGPGLRRLAEVGRLLNGSGLLLGSHFVGFRGSESFGVKLLKYPVRQVSLCTK